jgi:hypothetical protein
MDERLVRAAENATLKFARVLSALLVTVKWSQREVK